MPLRQPWKTTQPVLQWGPRNNLRQLALKCSELITCAILWQIMSTRQRWLTSRRVRNTPTHRMSKTFFQSGPSKLQVPLLRPAKSSNPHRLSHLDLSRLLPWGRISKTSFNLHNPSRTSSNLPSLHKTSSSSNLHGQPKTSSILLLRWVSYSRIKTSLRTCSLSSSHSRWNSR
jgi:hypothetical protein